MTGELGGLALPRTLIVTGHFPPSHGGVQRFTAEMARHLPPEQVVVAALTRSDEMGASDVEDRRFGAPVHRIRGPWYANPRFTREVIDLAQRHECEAAWITSAMPLGAIAPVLRRAGIERVTVSTHGMEVGWSRVAPARSVMRSLSRSIDVLTYLGEFTRPHMERVIAPEVELRKLTGGVDVDQFHPGASADEVRALHGLEGRRVVVSVSRLVPRKGQDMLLRAWPAVLRRHPDAVLLVVGDGPHRRVLEQLASDLGVSAHVRFAGMVSDAVLPNYLAAAEVFALPCRTVWHGLQPEGLGLCTLEASATGLPVVVGDSGGAPEALIDGQTGIVVDTDHVPGLADALCTLLDDPQLARRMGNAGRRWVEQHWTWQQMAARLAETLTDPLEQAA